MSYASKAGEGTIFKIGLAANSVDVLTGVNTVDFDGVEVEAIDDFHMGDTVKKQRPSLMIDYGKTSLELDYDPTDTVHKLVRDAHAAKTTVYFEVTWYGGAKSAGHGFITGFNIKGAGKSAGQLTVSIEIKNNDFSHTDPS